MKLIICLLIILTNYVPIHEGHMTNDYSTDISSGNIDNLKEKGLKTIDEQTFSISNNWGQVKFIVGEIEVEGNNKLVIYLVDHKDHILYEFPPFFGNEYGYFYVLKAVDFNDVNNDGLMDIVIIADYMNGIGEMGAIPVSVAGIYFQKDKHFFTLPELDMSINDNLKNDSIETVISHAHEQLKNSNK